MSAILALVLRLALASALYAFLGWAVWSLVRDLEIGGQFATEENIPSLALSFEIDGRQVHFQTSDSLMTIGRDPANNCPIPNSTVSSFHAQLEFHHNQWWLQDLGSRNGTFLNQQPVEGAVVVTNGDQVGCGNVLIGLSIDRTS